MTECLIGLKFRDFVLLASDTTAASSRIIVAKDDEDKTFKMGSRLLMGIWGEDGDTTQFAEYCAKNIMLYKMRNSYELTPMAAANFIRRNIAEHLRSRTPYHVNLLLAGYDVDEGSKLYYMDYIGTMAEVPYVAQGYGSMFSLALMDNCYKPDMTREEGYALLEKCVHEIQKRFIICFPSFKVQVIDKDGISSMPNIVRKQVQGA